MPANVSKKILGPLKKVVKPCVMKSAVYFVDVLECGHEVRADPNHDNPPVRRRCLDCFIVAKRETSG